MDAPFTTTNEVPAAPSNVTPVAPSEVGTSDGDGRTASGSALGRVHARDGRPRGRAHDVAATGVNVRRQSQARHLPVGGRGDTGRDLAASLQCLDANATVVAVVDLAGRAEPEIDLPHVVQPRERDERLTARGGEVLHRLDAQLDTQSAARLVAGDGLAAEHLGIVAVGVSVLGRQGDGCRLASERNELSAARVDELQRAILDATVSGGGPGHAIPPTR